MLVLNVCLALTIPFALFFIFYIYFLASSPSPSEKENNTILAHMHMSLRHHHHPAAAMTAGHEAKPVFPDTRSAQFPPAMQYMGMGHFQNWQLAAH
jgi:hypothetical protein